MRPRNVGKQPHFGTYVHALPCECGKRGYKCRADAKTVVKEMRRNGARDPERLQAYRCSTDPDYWHVGHRPYVGRNLNAPEVAW